MRDVRTAIPARTVRYRDRVLRPVVLAEGNDVDTQLIGEHRLVHDLPYRGRV